MIYSVQSLAHRSTLSPESTEDPFAGQFASTGFASDPFAGDPFASTTAVTAASSTKADDPFDPFGALSIPPVSVGMLFSLTHRLLIDRLSIHRKEPVIPFPALIHSVLDQSHQHLSCHQKKVLADHHRDHCLLKTAVKSPVLLLIHGLLLILLQQTAAAQAPAFRPQQQQPVHLIRLDQAAATSQTLPTSIRYSQPVLNSPHSIYYSLSGPELFRKDIYILATFFQFS